MNILLIGQTSLQWGRMEFGNIGNYYVIEPFIRELHKNFPGASISTTLQMSDRFCKQENITVVPLELYYDFSRKDNLEIAKYEYELVQQYLNHGTFPDKTPYIDELLQADIVIDYSGDIWGDNANFLGNDRFEVGLYKDLLAQKLGKPTFMIAGSPGPFNKDETKKLAKEVFKNFVFVTNREPISTKILEEEGFSTENVKDLACPAFLFEPAFGKEINRLLEIEHIIVQDKPTVGFILCGWNFETEPFDKWPRGDEEYTVFVSAVEYIVNTLGARVCLMSHSNGFPIPPADFKLHHGRDYPIVKQLKEILDERGTFKDVFLLDRVCSAWETKAIISNFDMLVSGRVHAAVASMSQLVPTVILDYGHEPKAHKLSGFARVAGQERFICNPACENDVIQKIAECWKNRMQVKRELKKRIPVVKELAKENFVLLRKAYSILNGEAR